MEIFWKLFLLRVIKKYDKSALMMISQVFLTPINVLTIKGGSETAL